MIDETRFNVRLNLVRDFLEGSNFSTIVRGDVGFDFLSLRKANVLSLLLGDSAKRILKTGSSDHPEVLIAVKTSAWNTETLTGLGGHSVITPSSSPWRLNSRSFHL